MEPTVSLMESIQHYTYRLVRSLKQNQFLCGVLLVGIVLFGNIGFVGAGGGKCSTCKDIVKKFKEVS